ncbi:MAG: hypothetical protein IJE05_00050 [Clostridia bacterium]|nr:hypothetical protein [Clostridia bacterium]
MNIEESLENELQWRIEIFSYLKTIPKRRSFSDKEQEIYYNSIIPIIYSHLEGFINKAINIYSTYINKLGVNYLDYHPNILLHIIENKYNNVFEDAIKNTNSKNKIINKFCNDIKNEDMSIPIKANRNMNMNCKRINILLNSFNIKPISEDKYESKLDALLGKRNCIAHGEASIQVSDTDITDYIKLVSGVIEDIIINITEAYNNKDYYNDDIRNNLNKI